MKLLFTLSLTFFSITAFCQGAASLCWRNDQRGDTVCHQQQFDSLVRMYTRKLNAQAVMNSHDYVMIVKLDNTISVNASRICPFNENELYKAFNLAMPARYFFDKLTEYLGDCIPNRGMGCYYSNYKLDWGGAAPNNKSLIQVKP